MYRVYVLHQRPGGSRVLTDTRTQSTLFAAAEAAFWALRQADYDEQHLLLMSLNGRQINAHRYGSQPGDRDHVPLGSMLHHQVTDGH